MAEHTDTPPHEAPAEELTYDAATLAELSDLFGPVRLTAMLSSLQKEIEHRLDGSSDDVRVIGQGAHALASASGMLGFMPLSRACAALERACLNGHGIGSERSAARAAARRAREAIIRLRAATT